MASTYLLLWNRRKWEGDAEWPNKAERDTARGKLFREDWSTGNRKDLPTGSRIFLLRVGRQPGLIASGTSTSTVFSGKHWLRPGAKANYVPVAFDTVLAPDEVLPVAVLQSAMPDFPWSRLQASGVHIQPHLDELLESLWRDHLAALRQQLDPLPEEVQAGRWFIEGAVKWIMVNAYERDRRARDACLAHYGPTCAVCSLDFGKVYGERWKGLIHVHHLRDLASIRRQYRVDPINDLRPVCPNCHAMLHWGQTATSIEAVRRIIRTARKATNGKSER